MVYKDLPPLDTLSGLEKAKLEEYIAAQAEAFDDAINTLIAVDDALQKQIEAIRSYNDAVWEKVIKKYHPDAKLVEAVTVQPVDKLGDLLGRNRTNIQRLRNNINHLNETAAKFKKKP